MVNIRPFIDEDIKAIAGYANNANVSRYLTSRFPYPYTLADAEWWVKTGSKESGLVRAIDLEGECIGVVGIRYCDFERQYSGEIGYWLGERHWGKGIASVALQKMTKLAFDDTHMQRLFASVFAHNKASMRVLEKCGYELEAVMQRALFKHGEFCDEFIFAKLRS